MPKAQSQGRTHYLPHHGVIRQDKQTTKLRIVYNGSMKSSADSISLNDCLETGPNLIPKLFNVLIKFRWHMVTITADIEMAPDDRDVYESPVLQLRFTCLVFGLRPSPAILGTVISHRLGKYQSAQQELIQFIRDSFYADDLITGGESIEDAFRIYQVAKQTLADGGFNLRKWDSNSQELRDKIASDSLRESPEATSYSVNDSNTQDSHQLQTKLLGISYDSHSDDFYFCFTELIEHISKFPASRRSLLKVTASMFDPLGLLSPFIIRLKMLFQTLCSKGIGWDRPLEGEHLNQWHNLTTELEVSDTTLLFLYGVNPCG